MFIFLFSLLADYFQPGRGWFQSTVSKDNSFTIQNDSPSETKYVLFLMQHGNLTGAKYFMTENNLPDLYQISYTGDSAPKFFYLNLFNRLTIQATGTSFKVQGWLLDISEIGGVGIEEYAALFLQFPLKSKFSISRVNKDQLLFFTWLKENDVDEKITVSVDGTYFLNHWGFTNNVIDFVEFKKDETHNLKKQYFFSFSKDKAELNPTDFLIENHRSGVSIDGETCEYHHLYKVQKHVFTPLDDLHNPSVSCEDRSDSFKWWHWFVIAIGIAAVLSIIFLLVMFFVFGIACCCQCPNCGNTGDDSWGRERLNGKYEGSSSVSPVAF